jgi:hypothetical protein
VDVLPAVDVEELVPGVVVDVLPPVVVVEEGPLPVVVVAALPALLALGTLASPPPPPHAVRAATVTMASVPTMRFICFNSEDGKARSLIGIVGRLAN